MASRGGATGRPVNSEAKKEVYTKMFETGATDRARLAHAVEEAEIDRRAAEELANIGRMRKGFAGKADESVATSVDPEVALYYRKRMVPKSLPGLWDKMMKRVYAAGAKLSLAVVAVVFSGMLAFAIVIAVIIANWPREAVHHYFLENHARALAGLPETTYAEALRQARYIPWALPQPRCQAAKEAMMAGGDVAAALLGGGGEGGSETYGEEVQRRRRLLGRPSSGGRSLLSGSGAWRTDELDPEEWAGLLLPDADARRTMLDFLYSRAVTCPFRTKDCTSTANFTSHKPDVPLGSWGSCAVVGRDAALLGANYADFIDAHDTVFRFANSARPGYEKYVGRKTDVTYMEFDCQSSPNPPTVPPELHPSKLWLLEDKGRSPRHRAEFDCMKEQAKFVPPAVRRSPPPPPPKVAAGAGAGAAAQGGAAAGAAPTGKQASWAARIASVKAGAAGAESDPEAAKAASGWGDWQAPKQSPPYFWHRRRSLLKDHVIPGVSHNDQRLDDWRAKAHKLVKSKKRKPLPQANAAPAQGGGGGRANAQMRSLPGAPTCDYVYEQSLMKPPYCPHDWNGGWEGKPVLLSEHSPPTLEPSPSTRDRQHMRDFSSALLAKVVELSPGMADVDNTRDDVLEMSSEMFFTVHLLYSGLCTSVDLFGLPQFPDGATYYGERTRKGYASRLETTLARLLETNLTLCVFDGFDSGNQH